MVEIISFKIKDVDRDVIYLPDHNGEFMNVYSHGMEEYTDNIGGIYLYVKDKNSIGAGYLGSCDTVEDLSYHIPNYEIIFIYK